MKNDIPNLRIAFAGDRDIAIEVLKRILADGVKPLALLVPEKAKASHAQELIELCSFLPAERILIGQAFRRTDSVILLKQMDLDFIIGVHFPAIIPPEILSIPKQGVLNLHPAFLPYNRGWHTPSWAILEDTPIGATLHFMNEDVDTGDIIHKKQISVSPGDTAHSLYLKLKKLELEVFQEAWPEILSGTYTRTPQDLATGTTHRRKDLSAPDVQRIELDAQVKVSHLLKKLRALTTNRIDEAAYFEAEGRRYSIQLVIHEE